jgi:hypothetical protein
MAGFLAEDASTLVQEMAKNTYLGNIKNITYLSDKAAEWPNLRFASLRFDDSGLSDYWAFPSQEAVAKEFKKMYNANRKTAKKLDLDVKVADEGLAIDWLEQLVSAESIEPGFSELAAVATALDTINLYQQASPYILPTIELAARLALFQEKKTLTSLFSRTQ